MLRRFQQDSQNIRSRAQLFFVDNSSCSEGFNWSIILREIFLREAMTLKQFEKQIMHLDQIQILSGSISSLNKLLVDKRIVNSTELQKYFLSWMQEKKLAKRKRAKNSTAG